MRRSPRFLADRVALSPCRQRTGAIAPTLLLMVGVRIPPFRPRPLPFTQVQEEQPTLPGHRHKRRQQVSCKPRRRCDKGVSATGSSPPVGLHGAPSAAPSPRSSTPPSLPSPPMPAHGTVPAAADADSPTTIGHERAEAHLNRCGNLRVLAAPPGGPAPSARVDFGEKHGGDVGGQGMVAVLFPVVVVEYQSWNHRTLDCLTCSQRGVAKDNIPQFPPPPPTPSSCLIISTTPSLSSLSSGHIAPLGRIAIITASDMETRFRVRYRNLFPLSAQIV